MKMTKLTCFKAYDIRGKLGTELNEEIAYLALVFKTQAAGDAIFKLILCCLAVEWPDA